MASSAADLARRLGSVATAVERGQREAVNQTAFVAKQEMIDGIGKSGVKPSSMLGGRKWSVGYNVRGQTRPMALVSYRGPVHWIEGGTKPRVVGARRLGTRAGIQRNVGSGSFGRFRSSRGAKALNIPGIGFRAYANHPGTRARPFWTRTKARIAQRGPEVMQHQLRRQIARSSFGTGSTSVQRDTRSRRAPRNTWTPTNL